MKRLSKIALITSGVVSCSLALSVPFTSSVYAAVQESEQLRVQEKGYSSSIVLVSNNGTETVNVPNSLVTVDNVLKDRGYSSEDFKLETGEPVKSEVKVPNGSKFVLYEESIEGNSQVVDLPVTDKIVKDTELYKGQKVVSESGEPGKAIATTVVEQTVIDGKPQKSEKTFITVLTPPKQRVVTEGEKDCVDARLCELIANGGGDLTVESNAKYVHPLGKNTPWTTYSGGRSHDNGAVDIPEETGTPIYAIADGEVTDSGWLGGGGNMAVIRHSDGHLSGYAHMVNEPLVKKGDKVKVGQIIGFVGSTGNSTGPHLHFEIFKNKVWGDSVPAYEYMKLHGVELGPCVGGPCHLSKKS